MELFSDPSSPVVRLLGDLDCATAPEVETLLIGRLADRGSVVVDLGDLSFLDCAGLGALIAARGWAERHGLRLALTRPSPAAARLLALVGPGIADVVPAVPAAA